MNKIFELCKNLSKLTHIDNVYIIVITEIIISYLFIRIIRFIITKIGVSLIKDSRKKYLYHKKINVFSSLIFVIIVLIVPKTLSLNGLCFSILNTLPSIS